MGVLFRPQLPVQVVKFALRNVFPGHRRRFTRGLNNLMTHRLVSFSRVTRGVGSPSAIRGMLPVMRRGMSRFVGAGLSRRVPLLSVFVGDRALSGVGGNVMRRMRLVFPTVVNRLAGNVGRRLGIRRVMARGIDGFDSSGLRRVLLDVVDGRFGFMRVVNNMLKFVVKVLRVTLTHVWFLGLTSCRSGCVGRGGGSVELTSELSGVRRPRAVHVTGLDERLHTRNGSVVSLDLNRPSFKAPRRVGSTTVGTVRSNCAGCPPMTKFPRLERTVISGLGHSGGLRFAASRIVIYANTGRYVTGTVLDVLGSKSRIVIPTPF